ncbi:unnamed protein product [Chironomus riparius]|uniref:ADF-H domain-containing protein n=1 Tax=Chironomus riparius TaxID=315576 RepID=A0A9N9RJ88_9DIPT|nr:unnamed protein product [Chironomus riparius]
MCDIGPEVKEELRKFRFAKNNESSALILKVDREKQEIVIDEYMESVTVEELQEQLPSHQPRFIVYAYKMIHDDRVSYPLCFIFYTPLDSQMELQMLYARSKLPLQKQADLTRSYEIREIEDFTEEWLIGKLSK